MIQKTYRITDFADGSFERAVDDLKNCSYYESSKSILITLYEQNWDTKEIERKRDYIKEQLPKAEIVGTTHFEWENTNENHTIISALFFDSSNFEIIGYDLSKLDEIAAGNKLNANIKSHPNAKGVLILVSNIFKNIDILLKAAEKDVTDVPMFGASSGANLDSYDGFDNKYVFDNNIVTANYMFAVIFYGDELNIKVNYNFGWTPIGKVMTITDTTDAFNVKTIDDAPAANIYERYFGLKDRQINMFNTCEFPLVIEEDDTLISRFPIMGAPDGSMLYGCPFKVGDKIRFTYGSLWKILDEVENDSISLQDFAPEALLLVVCINRKLFLKDEEHREIDSYRKVLPSLVHFHGNSEIYRHNGRGAELNSALVSIAMREGDKNPDFVKNNIDRIIESDLRTKDVLPLEYRITSFLNAITKDLEDVAQEARDANKAKSLFLSSMSHEIRTPINAVLGMNEMILRETSDFTIKEYAMDIKSAGSTLHSLINDILDTSKIESGKMDLVLEEYDTATMIHDLSAMVSTRARDKKLKFKTEVSKDIPSKLFGDDVRIKQILTNILTNATKYTHEGSVTLRASSTINDDIATIHFEVEDTGIGIKEEDMPKLFEAFKRIDEHKNRNIEGTGLGMNITLQLLKMMGSSLKVESQYGVGSKFYFDLEQKIIDKNPIGDLNSRLKHSATRYNYSSSFTAPDAKLLVVDDNEMNLKVFCGLLKKTLINITTALSGKEALEIAEKEKFDIIFLDHMMPEMDGIKTLQNLKAQGESSLNANTPIYALTANAVADAAEMYQKEGFSGYVSKPIEPAKLEAMIAEELGY